MAGRGRGVGRGRGRGRGRGVAKNKQQRAQQYRLVQHVDVDVNEYREFQKKN